MFRQATKVQQVVIENKSSSGVPTRLTPGTRLVDPLLGPLVPFGKHAHDGGGTGAPGREKLRQKANYTKKLVLAATSS
jgi:hypothetical protein